MKKLLDVVRCVTKLVALCTFTAAMQGCSSGLSTKVSPIPSLAEAYRGRLKIGAAVEPLHLKTTEGELLARQFNSVVAENVMKPSRIQPREGEFDFEPADAIVDFARSHSMTMRGHTLLWYRRTPDWFWFDKEGMPASRDLVLSRLKRHIEVVVGRYKSDVYAWDVVNEVIDATQANCLRNDKWFQVVGPDYIDLAFRYANAVDPKTRLFINDYSTTQPEKQRCLERVVQGLLARGVPIHGVGHQMHVSIFEPSEADVDQALTVFARLGLENQITELDMSLYQRQTYLLPDEADKLLVKQAERYRSLMNIFLAHPELTAVTWWGVSDGHTHLNSAWNWWRSDQPLLFDRQQRPKASYWEVLEAARVLRQ